MYRFFIVFAVLLIGATVQSTAQNTTQEEFNFMQVGYKTMLESGLDMKKGYSLRDTMNFSVASDNYQISYLNLVRDKDRTLAGTIAVIKSRLWNKVYFLGILAANTNGSVDVEKTLMATIKEYGWDANIKTAFMQSLAEYMSISMTKRYIQKTNSR